MEGVPYFGFNNFGGVGDSGYRPISNVEMTEDYRDNLTWTHGRHTVTAGADLSGCKIFANRILTLPVANSPLMGSFRPWRERFRASVECPIWRT